MRLLVVALCAAITATASSASTQARTVAERCFDTGNSSGLEAISLNAIHKELAEEIEKAPPIALALGKARRAELRRLLSENVDPNVCLAGGSLLSISASAGDVDEVDLLLSGGADANRPRDSRGGTPLHTALSAGRLAVAQRLLQRGADPLVVTDSGLTSLHELTLAPSVRVSADSKLQLDIAHELVARGVDVNARAMVHRTTALMLAALQGNTPLVELLIQAKADPNIQDAKGKTAMTFAQSRGHNTVVQLLKHATTTHR
jgi:ankyrin repeat protein